MKFFTVLSLLLEFFKTHPFIILFVIALNSIHYLRTIIIPKNISSITMASGIVSKKLILYTLLQIIILVIGMGIYEIADNKLHLAIQDFHLNTFFTSLFDNREKSLDKPIPPSVYANIISYTNSINDLFFSFFLILPILVTLLGLLQFIYVHDKVSFLICLFVMSLAVTGLIYSALKIKDYSLIYNRKKDELIDKSSDINNNIISVLAFNQRDNEKKNINNKIKEYLSYFAIYNYFKILFLESFSFPTTILLSYILIRFYAKLKLGILSKEVFVQTVVIFMSFMTSTLIKDLIQISRLFYKYGKSKNCLDSINKFYVKNDNLENNNRYKKTSKSILELKNINYLINDNHILKNLNINFNMNEFTCIKGKIGSGKSSLINLIFGTRKLNDGNIFLNDMDIISTDSIKWKNNFHFCAQHPILFDRSVNSNLFYGQEADMEKLKEISKIIGIEEIVDSLLDKKYNVGESGFKLSGGEKQIISLLRIALNPKKIIILDEPTASLDKFHKNIVCDIIKYIKKNNQVCILVISHDNILIEKADRIINLDKGIIISDTKINSN